MPKLQTSAAKRVKISRRDLFVDAMTSKLRKFNDRLIWIQGIGSRQSEYFIYDALFTHLWRAGRDRGRKRTGFILKFDREFITLGVNTEHLKTPFANLKSHLQGSVNPLFKTFKSIEKYDSQLSWSSKSCYREANGKIACALINFGGRKDLESILKDQYKIDSIELLAKDLGLRLAKINTPHEINPARGTHFQVCIKVKNDLSPSAAAKLIERFFPIFNCFYPPLKEKSFRASNYRKKLINFYKQMKMPLGCGYKNCSVKEEKDLIASHIQAVQHGGTDDLYNLVFLCRDHSIKLEGASFEDFRKNLKDRFKRHTKL